MDDGLLATLRQRFTAHPARHPGVRWEDVAARLAADVDGRAAVAAMERTGGEPDVVAFDLRSGAVTFVDCAPESPEGRRSLCYDGEARLGRRQAPPVSSAVERAAEWGLELLDEEAYAALQRLGAFDRRTSSWLRTPPDIRARGGALFGDLRYGRVFTYHNGADSYFGARGFRARRVV